MGTKERREREREELRGKILDAARQMFLEEGYDAVSMRRIAEKIEYSPTALYLHFPDKEALFRQICIEDFVGLGKRFAGLAKAADPMARIRKLGEAYVSFALDHPNHYRFLFMTPLPHLPLDEQQERIKGDPAQDSYALLRATCAEAIEGGGVRPDLTDPDLMAQVCWAGVHGIASLWIDRAEEHWIPMRPARKVVAALLDAMLDGLSTSPRRRS